MLKKVTLTVLPFILFACSNSLKPTASIPEKLTVLRADKSTVKYSINQEKPRNWKLSPNVKPDRLRVECKQKINLVRFSSGIDSATFKVQEGSLIRFYIVHGTDSALTEIAGTPKNVNFSAEYIKANTGKTAIEIPEVQELANILVAISNIGQLDSNMVDMTSPYYREVMAHFLPYRDHPILDTINQHITKPLDTKSYWYYYALKMNACAYVYNDQGEIVNEGIVRKMGFNNEEDPIKTHTALIQDFAVKSNFRAFYKQHQPYYQQLISTYASLNPLTQMQAWLQQKFPLSYSNYRIIFSPLVGGAHATQRYQDNGFEQTVMFVARAEYDKKYSKEYNEMTNSRVVFTEIDHNFVNPLSDQYLPQINKAFSNRTNWVKKGAGTQAYDTPYMVFNEYMTYAVFSLYCLDHYTPEEVAKYLPKMEKQMANGRGFIMFPKFNQHLISLYRQNRQIGIPDLYQAIIQWSEEQNKAKN